MSEKCFHACAAPLPMSLHDYFSSAKPTRSKKRRREETEATETVDKENVDPADPNTSEGSSPPRKRVRLTDVEDEKDRSDNDDDKPERVIPEVVTFTNAHLCIPGEWYDQLHKEFGKPYFRSLMSKLEREEKSGAQIFPPAAQVYRAFELCEWTNLKVVILGQDPYHDDNQAEGLCFSIPRGIKCKFPGSLRNIYKEAESDVGFQHPNHGNLVEWAQQGVLLLNTGLTVRAHQANSHKKFGWLTFTDAVIKIISRHHDGVVFILWGKQAQNKKSLINLSKHRAVESPHPSPLSASRGFFGSKPFSKTNELLRELGKDEINWQTTP